jgi:hypothetical protein
VGSKANPTESYFGREQIDIYRYIPSIGYFEIGYSKRLGSPVTVAGKGIKVSVDSAEYDKNGSLFPDIRTIRQGFISVSYPAYDIS